MKHAVIVGHPDEASFTLALAKRYVETIASLQQTSVVRDLYRLNFDPRLQLSELPTRENWAPAADAEAEIALVPRLDLAYGAAIILQRLGRDHDRAYRTDFRALRRGFAAAGNQRGEAQDQRGPAGSAPQCVAR